jgi:hypothetical protein
MIDIGGILKRAWHILWNYKVLWLFGLLLALTTSGGSGSGPRFSSSGGLPSGNFNNSSILQDFNRWMAQDIGPVLLHPERFIITLIWIGVGLLLLGLVVGIAFAILRYVSEAAVIRMVNEYEQTGTKVGFGQGWRMGWSRAAFRMWLIDLIIAIPAVVFVLLLLLLGLAVYFEVRGGLSPAGVVGLVATIGLGILVLLAFILAMVVLKFLSQFFKRSAALENNGVGESFRSGWALVRRNWKSAGLMWLVLFGVGIGLAIAGVVVAVLLIPVYILLALPGLIVAIIPAAAAFGVAALFVGSPWTWIIALLAGAPFFLLVVGSPLLLLGGWIQVFTSSVWTLTYREIKALEVVTPQGA